MMKDARLRQVLVLSSYALAMLVFSACVGLALLWVAPLWLQNVAFWRGPLLEDRPALHELAVGQIEEEVVAEVEARPNDLLADMAVSVSYEPRLGALAEHPLGATLSLPDGALRSSATIRLEPVLPEGDQLPARGRLLGFGFRVLIDGQADGVLRKDATLRLQVLDGAAAGNWRIVHRDGSSWKVPTTQRRGNVLSIRVDRGGLFLPMDWSAAADAGDAQRLLRQYLTSGAMVADARLNRIYDTQHFQVFYADRGVHAVPDAAALGLDAGSRVNAFVSLVGETLEFVYQRLERTGLTRVEDRLDVYLSSAHGDALTPIGGPLWVSVRPDVYAAGEDMPAAVRGVVTEALLRALLGQGTPWFDAMQAAFLTEDFWAQEPQVVKHLHFLAARYPERAARLLETPMDRGDALQARLYALFFAWLNQRGDVPDLLARLKRAQDLDGAMLSRVLQQRGQPALGDLLALFARDFYHDRFWQEEQLAAHLFAGDHRQQALLQSGVPRSFATGLYDPAHVYRNVEAFRLAPQSSLLVPFVDTVALDRAARLVVLAEFRGPKPIVNLASAQMDAALPLAGVPSRFEEIQPREERMLWQFEARADAPLPNHISFIFSNVAESGTRQISRLARWLLHAPVWAVVDAQNGEDVLAWQPADVEQLRAVFAGYNIYAMAEDQAFADAVLLERGYLQPRYAVTAPVAGQRYAVTVMDVYGNESPPTFVATEDPFVGRWRGRVRWYGDDGIRDAAERVVGTFGLAALDTSLLPDDDHFAWRVGMPVTFEVVREEGSYRMRVTRLGFSERLPKPSDPSYARLSEYGLFADGAGGEFVRRWTLARENLMHWTTSKETGDLDYLFWRVSAEEAGR